LQTKIVEKIKTHNYFLITFFFENRAIYEINVKNMLQPVRPQMTIRRMRIAYWIPKATNTHLEYVILLTFPLQQWLHGLASMLRHTYIACLFFSLSRIVNRSVGYQGRTCSRQTMTL